MSLRLYIPKHSFFHLKSKDLFENFPLKARRLKNVELFVFEKKKTYDQHCAHAVYPTLTRLGSRKLRPTLYF